MSDIITDKNGKTVIPDINLDEKQAQENIDDAENKELKHKENGITIDRLIENYLKRTSTKMKEEYLKAEIKVRPYVGYGTKVFLANTIINTTCLKDGRVHIDSCKKYLLYVFSLIDTYTNIEVDSKNWLLQYDRLDSLNLIEPILALIPEKEVVTFKTILDMKLDDLMTNRYGVHAYVDEQMERFNAIAPEIGKAFSPLIDKLNKQIESLDESKIEKMISKFGKFVK